MRESTVGQGRDRSVPSAMSCDFGIWYPHERLTDAQAGAVYAALCEGDVSRVRPHPAVDAFYEELTARHPEIDDVPEDRIDDHELCPWSCAMDRSSAHLVIASVWSRAEATHRTLLELARKHGVALFDPQSGCIAYPDGTTGAAKPWWKLW